MAFISSQYFFIWDQFMQWSRKSDCKDWCVSFWDASSPVSWGFIINCLMAGNGMKKSGASLISAGSSWEMVPLNQWWKLVQLLQSTRIGWILLLGVQLSASLSYCLPGMKQRRSTCTDSYGFIRVAISCFLTP